MRFLADMGVSISTVRTLRELGHDSIHLRELGLERLADRAILNKARDEGRIVLTFDLDFSDLLATGSDIFPSVVIFRLHDQRPTSVTPRLLRVVESRAKELQHGALVIVEDARHRLRHLPLREIEDE